MSRFFAPLLHVVILLFVPCTVHADDAAKPAKVAVDDSVEIRLVGEAANAYFDAWPGTSARDARGAGGPLGLHGKIMRKKAASFEVEAYVVIGRDGESPTLITVTASATASEFVRQPPFTDAEAKRKGTPAFVVAAIRKRRTRPLVTFKDPNRVEIKQWTVSARR